MTSPNSQIARLDERMISLEEKLDLFQKQLSENHQTLRSDLFCLKKELKSFVYDNAKKNEQVRDDINTLKHDKVWMTSIFGLVWAIVLIYINWKLKTI